MEVTFKKCGICINPPAFLVVYQTEEKIKRKIMPLRNFTTNSDVEFVAEELTKRHFLKGIPLVKIEKMLRFLQELLKGFDQSEALKKIEKEFEIKLNDDLNKLSTKELEVQKKLMDSLFLKNQIKKEDEDFIYDKRVDFNNEKEFSNWDLDSDNFWD